jgi:suppressor of fused protein SUFU
VDVLWLLPITQAERDFKVAHGLEALEQRFDNSALEYWDICRKSVV